MAEPAGGGGGGRHPAGRQVDCQRGRVVDQPGRVLYRAGVGPAVLDTHSRDGDGAAEAVQAADESVGGGPEVSQAGMSPGEGEREVALGSLTGDPGPAGQHQVRPEVEGDNLGRQNTLTATEVENTGQEITVTAPHQHHLLCNDVRARQFK